MKMKGRNLFRDFKYGLIKIARLIIRLFLLSVLGFRSNIFVMIYNILFAQKLLFIQSDH